MKLEGRKMKRKIRMIMGKLYEEFKRFLVTATPEELERARKKAELFKDVGPSVKDFWKQYEKVGKSEWFKKVYNGKSIGETIECDDTHNLKADADMFLRLAQKPTEWHREDEQNLNACLGYIPDEFLRRWLMDAILAKYDKLAENKDAEQASKEYADNNRVFGEGKAGIAYNYYDIMDAYKAGAQWQKEQIIDKACEWLNAHMPFGEVDKEFRDGIIEDFRKAMKGE